MKKLNKKGFTLVELMGVITLLCIILLIAIPAVTRFLGKSKDQYYKTTMDNIEAAVEEYLLDYPDDVPIQNKGYTEIPLNMLIKLKYIDPIKNPETKETCTEDSYIYVTNEGYKNQQNNEASSIQGANMNLSFDICLKCGVYKGNNTMGTCKKSTRNVGFTDSNRNAIQTVTLSKGTKYDLFLYNFSTKKYVSYSNANYISSNENVASISYGTLTAKNVGTTIIQATSGVKTFLIVNVVDTPIKVNNITAWTSTTMITSVNKIIKNMTVYTEIKPDNANKDITCSIVDENNNVVTQYGQATKETFRPTFTATNQTRYIYGCKYTRFAFDDPTTIIDPITNEKTTNTYLMIQPTFATKDSAFLKIPIYTE